MKHLPDLHFNKIDLFWAPEMSEGKNLIQIIVPEHEHYFLDYEELPSRHTLFCFTRAALCNRRQINSSVGHSALLLEQTSRIAIDSFFLLASMC